MIRFAASSRTECIRPVRFHFGAMQSYRTQLPLALGWALSIHKSQGMSLDRLQVCLSRVFECGQAYVALSRARSLDGLVVMDLTINACRASDEVLRFYRENDLI